MERSVEISEFHKVATGSGSGMHGRLERAKKARETLHINPERSTPFELCPRTFDIYIADPRRYSFVRWSAQRNYRMEAVALPAGQAAVDDSAPSNFSTLLTRWVFRVDPWLQRAFEALEKNQDETTGKWTYVTIPRPSIAGYDSNRMFSFTTARWHQWKDLPAKVGLVVSNAHKVGVNVAPEDWRLL
jgi:hypothetical protein